MWREEGYFLDLEDEVAKNYVSMFVNMRHDREDVQMSALGSINIKNYEFFNSHIFYFSIEMFYVFGQEESIKIWNQEGRSLRTFALRRLFRLFFRFKQTYWKI